MSFSYFVKVIIWTMGLTAYLWTDMKFTRSLITEQQLMHFSLSNKT